MSLLSRLARSKSARFAWITTSSFTPITLCTSFYVPAAAQTQFLPPKPVWEQTSTGPLEKNLEWTPVEAFGSVPAQFRPIPSKVSAEELAAKPRVEGPYKGRGIYGIGGGVRAGSYTGDSTAGFVTGRIGYKLDDNFAISIRPTGIYGNGFDSGNSDNGNGFEFRLPLTLDLFHKSFISPYIGGGIATNVDNLGYTDGMLSGGVDISITKWIVLGLNVNYIYQSNIDDTDWEALGMLYLRF
jgi:hypothetical protein